MTKILLNIRVSRDVADPSSPSGIRHISSYPEEVDLDALTPRARALAEAMHAARDRSTPVTLVWRSLVRDNPAFDWQYAEHPDRDAIGAQQQTTMYYPWRAAVPADSRTTLMEWLETHAHELPLDCHVQGPAHEGPVPSMAAGAADVHVTRESLLPYLRSAGVPMSPQEWDALRGTPEHPRPDRYVCGRPQWRPETLDAWIRERLSR